MPPTNPLLFIISGGGFWATSNVRAVGHGAVETRGRVAAGRSLQRRAALQLGRGGEEEGDSTLDALIAEALEVEEENRESLRRFLEQEEERRAKQRQRKERITGPFVRWMSSAQDQGG